MGRPEFAVTTRFGGAALVCHQEIAHYKAQRGAGLRPSGEPAPLNARQYQTSSAKTVRGQSVARLYPRCIS
jgi:hypothetical protein